jgi:BMFP domain-containing protein YqiC
MAKKRFRLPNFSWKLWLGVAIASLLLLLTLLQVPAPAQSVTNLTARITRLESENSGLRSRVSRLESQLSRVGNAVGVRVPQPPTEQGPVRGELSSDPMFDRLATLAIEQRERMDRLEARLNALEASQ